MSPEATVALEGSVVMTGGAVTVRVAAVVVAEPTELVKTASYSSPFSVVVAVNEKVVDVAPLMGAKVVPELVETSHCTVGFGVPVAAALKLAVSPEATVAFEGSVVMTGGAVTVRVAAVVVAEPTELVKTASYSSPFSLVVVVNEYFVEVPPLMGTVEVAPLMGTKVVPELVETSHCTVGAGLPEALDLNLTLLPDPMVTLNGSNVIFGTRFFLLTNVRASSRSGSACR